MAIKLKLQDILLFQNIPQEHSGAIADCATTLTKNDQEVVLLEGEPVLGIYIVLQGRVKVHTGHPLQPITFINAGEAFGEMSLVEKATASATIRADGNDTQLILIHGKRFQEKLESIPDLAAGFYKGAATILSRRLRETTRKVGHELQTRIKIDESIHQSNENTLAIQLEKISDKTELLQNTLLEDLKKWLSNLSVEQKAANNGVIKKDLEMDVSAHCRELQSIRNTILQVRQTLERVEQHLLAP